MSNNNPFNFNELESLEQNSFPFGSIRPLVGNEAPNFTSSAIMTDNTIKNDFNLTEYLEGSYGLIFFYPADFTFVCPSEIIAHNNRIKEFEKRNVKILGISVDSKHSHLAWKKLGTCDGGVGDLAFPLVSDSNKKISEAYRVANSEGVSLRGSFVIDKKGIIRHEMINDLQIGRNVDETLRIIDALLFVEKNSKVCPAGWKTGEEGIVETPEGIADYLSKNSKKL